ncbi:L-serine ammonia-lyase [Microbacterium sp. GCS4]|uniref:L-serine ammonia-lyase n=1 Tax=Microbacterium sp. GCS4 TaxID=1692239 RepID=UPI000682377E|nr:L-serine ammonia-lyase [Microbacterium sp. GCS4]KNY04028.1 serine ammonia-lyase [Microbacterium sp. GCS4]
MAISALDLYSIGIGPSSSHTVGPMRATRQFVDELRETRVLSRVARVRVDLFGSLAATGRGHGTDTAVVLGLVGEDPATIDPHGAAARIDAFWASGRIELGGTHSILFTRSDVVLHLGRSLEGHPNALTVTALGVEGETIRESTFFSIGGGFIVEDGVPDAPDDVVAVGHPFTTAADLLDVCDRSGLAISEVMRINERAWRSDDETSLGLREIWDVMAACVHAGSHTDGVLPGGLNVPRRASLLRQRLESDGEAAHHLHYMDWVSVYAMAVNEENAAGGRVVTAPTNGAAGIIPAVLQYYVNFFPDVDAESIERFLLTAAAIGIVIKSTASISGAEVGCQGEVGSACAMAAGALCEAFGGTPAQVENAAEIGLEHNLGLTCDPVGGLVQIPCIERNGIAAVKAIQAARLAMHGDGVHRVSLDQAIRTMRDTGRDMLTKYKETSLGGLAVNVVEC